MLVCILALVTASSANHTYKHMDLIHLKSREEGHHMTLPQKASWPLFEAKKVRMTLVSVILPQNHLWLQFSAVFCLLGCI